MVTLHIAHLYWRMKVHVSGAVSSPSCAKYALRRTLDDNVQHFPLEGINVVSLNANVHESC